MAIRLPSNLSELVGDVQIDAPADAQLLQYDADSGKWINWTHTLATAADLSAHTGDTANPHGVTAAQAGAVDRTGDTMTGGLVLGGDFTPGIGSKIQLRNYYDANLVAYFQDNTLYPVGVGLEVQPHTDGLSSAAVQFLDLAALAFGDSQDAMLAFDGTDLILTAGSNPIQLQPDFEGTGQGVELFANAASGDRPAIRLWGYPDAYNSAWSQSDAKYCDIALTTWNYLNFDGTFSGVEFGASLIMGWGSQIRLMPNGQGRIFAAEAGTNRNLRFASNDHNYGSYTIIPTWSFCHIDQNNYDFGYTFSPVPRVYIHAQGNSQTNYVLLYHDGTDGHIEAGAGDLQSNAHVDAAGFKVAGTAGASGTFTTADSKTVTVTNGLITSIA